MSSSITYIPLSRLTLSAANVRKAPAGSNLEELAASIEAHGLLQNLTVRSVPKANGKPSGTFEVVAGGRRLAALKNLATGRRIAKDYRVPCHVLADGDPVEISLAENVVRTPVHPADQFEAFAALHAQGHGAEEIAARFGIGATTVAQRLKLAAVSPRLLATYRDDGMSLEQLMAFTVTDDHVAQEQLWFENPYVAKDPASIRRALTAALVPSSDRRARFVGAQSYEAAGGTIVRDLFQPQDGGYFVDSVLLDRLVAEKLQTSAREIQAEGWSWVEVLPEMDYERLAHLRRIHPAAVPLSPDAQASLDTLTTRYDALVEEHGDDPPEEVAREIERLSDEIDKLAEGNLTWSSEDKARSGVLVALDHQGALRVERGLVKANAEPQAEREGPVEPKERVKAQVEGGSRRETSTLPEALFEDLTAHRTAALREMLAREPVLALTALVHHLVLKTFDGWREETCLEVSVSFLDLRPSAPGIGESSAVQAFSERYARWRQKLLEAPDLWSWVSAQDLGTKLELLALCVAATVNAVKRKHERADGHLRHADMLALAANLDMAEWWAPTRDRYLDRVPKSLILAAVAEGVSPQAAENLARLKKDAMAIRAEELLAGRRWLPAPLRSPGAPSPAPPQEPENPGTEEGQEADHA